MRYHQMTEGAARPTRNSEGKLIAGSAEDQAAFWQWFGNSKIVDAKGRPLVVHRGDEPGLTAFTGPQSSYIRGNIFFTDERTVAKGYTPHRTNSYLAAKDLDSSHGLYSAYLRIERPVVVDAKGANWSQIPLSGRLRQATNAHQLQIDDLALYVQQQKKNDGLIVKNVWDQFGDGTQCIVFSNQQIKLLPPPRKTAPKPKPHVWSRPVSFRWDDATQNYVEDDGSSDKH